MKITMVGMTTAAVFAVALGLSFPCYATQDQQKEKQDHGKPQQNTHQQSRPGQETRQQPKKQEAQAQQRGNSRGDRTQPQARQQQPSPPQQRQHPGNSQQHAQQARNEGRPNQGPQQQQARQNAWQQHRANDWQSEHRTWQQRGGYHGYRIPDDRFRGYFGEQHGFRIGGLPFMVYGGYPRFQYGGYWFSMVDPYPGNWSENWYDTDEVYVLYTNDGYYLFNRRHPGIGIAVSISR